MKKNGTNKIYWYGNAAKSRVIQDLLHRAAGSKKLVFDYGCGKAGDWPRILFENPNIRLVGYEPDKYSYLIAKKRLKGRNAVIFTGNIKDIPYFEADFVVSFSVLEHVYDKSAYLCTARRLLVKNGLFYLNYDDGHFRNLINLAEPTSWGNQLRELVLNLVAIPLAKIGQNTKFQCRVNSSEIDTLVKKIGFLIKKIEYHNLYCFKELFKNICTNKKFKFSCFWIEVENQLNARFRSNMTAKIKGDRTNLWTVALSRTMWLVKSNLLNKK